MKIYIIGTGGIGGYFGGLLARGEYDVTFVARGANYKALNENGLVVENVVENFIVKPVKVVESIKDISEPDLIIFSVKTYDTENAAKDLSSVVTEQTIIITFQNGVDNDTKIKGYVKKAQIYPGVAYIITAKTEPGIIRQTGGLRKLVFGDRHNSNNPRLKDIEVLMRRVGIDATMSDDIIRDIWKKFMFICPFSGLTAFHKKTIGEVLSDVGTRKQYEDCLKEAIAVAKAKGVTVSENAFDEVMKTSTNTAPDSKSSLLLDIENDRRNEIETLNGTLVRYANELKINVPINELIYKKFTSPSHSVKPQ